MRANDSLRGADSFLPVELKRKIAKDSVKAFYIAKRMVQPAMQFGAVAQEVLLFGVFYHNASLCVRVQEGIAGGSVAVECGAGKECNVRVVMLEDFLCVWAIAE